MSITLAKPYANAIFQLAEENRSHQNWLEILQTSVALYADQTMHAFIASPLASKASKASIMITLLTSILGKSPSKEECGFIRLLLANGRISELPSILQLVEQSINISSDTQTFQLISAYPLSQAQQQQITSDLARKYKTKVKLQIQIDKSLVGGVVIKIGDKVIDLSIKTKADALGMCLLAN